MFYENQPAEQKEKYKRLLQSIGSLSLLFSESNEPYLAYRAHENIFARAFEADNLARNDVSADVKKGPIGIGLKTWVGSPDQKVAEFGQLRPRFEHLAGIDLVRQISEYRNERIRITCNTYGLTSMIYHVVHRINEAMEICECSFDYIDIDNIEVIAGRGNANNTYFTDGNHTYHFSLSKNTLYMIFDNMEVLDIFHVDIHPDPYDFLYTMLGNGGAQIPILVEHFTPQRRVIDRANQLCLRLYTSNREGIKSVQEKSGLNQWNASGRPRHPNEIYIPYPAKDRERRQDFFPPRDTPFTLDLPNGTSISAKVCQDGGKAIMSNPNRVLGEWLLRNVFELPERTILTYDMLQVFGIDSVIFTRLDQGHYSVDFAEIGTYEEFYDDEDT